MKKKVRKKIDRYVRYCANEMGLRDWTLQVDLSTADDIREVDNHDGDDQVWGAACDPVRGRKFAAIILGPRVIESLLEGNRDEFRQTIAHELTHCHFAPLWEMMRHDLWEGRLMTQDTYDVFIKSAERNLEYGVDAMAEVVAQRLPLIELPK